MCVSGDLREMQGGLKQAINATNALARIGGDAQAQASSMEQLCAELDTEVQKLGKRLGTYDTSIAQDHSTMQLPPPAVLATHDCQLLLGTSAPAGLSARR